MTPRPRQPIQRRAPARASPRRLILCLDGTANNPFTERKRVDGSRVVKPTNVLKLARAIKPLAEDGVEQVTYYDTGVGAMSRHPGTTNRLLAASDKVFGGLGAGFEQNIEDALHFLVLNHRAGDEVFVFGFSRGAATAQALAKFLDWSKGLPEKNDAYWLPILFRSYIKEQGKRPCADLVEQINEDRRAHDREDRRTHGSDEIAPFRPVLIRFLGVWDTVMALGSRFKATGKKTSAKDWSFHMAPRPAGCVQTARQALAIDEVRYDFRPEVWQDRHPGQDMQQRWFAGVHTNVGGSYADDGLANIALRWMVKESKALGLDLDSRTLAFFPGYPYDRMYRSDKWYYRGLDAVRLRFGRGSRDLLAVPTTANATIDASVIHRMTWNKDSHGQHKEMTTNYRPRNVIRLLARQTDLAAYLAGIGLPGYRLPKDIIDAIKTAQS